MYILLFAGFAFLGGIINALLGWGDSQAAFNARKFTMSALRSLLAAVLAGASATVIVPTTLNAAVLMCFTAVLAGAGLGTWWGRGAALQSVHRAAWMSHWSRYPGTEWYGDTVSRRGNCSLCGLEHRLRKCHHD